MKKLFTLAIISLIASLTFAQAPVMQQKALKTHKIEKLAVKGMNENAMKGQALREKAQAAQETSSSVLRVAKKPFNAAVMQQMNAPKTFTQTILSRRALTNPRKMVADQLMNKTHARAAQSMSSIAKFAPKHVEGEYDLELNATESAQTVYEEDGDTYCVLLYGSNAFRFDILTTSLVPGHVYTLADMDPDYSWCKIGTSSYEYTEATYVTNADGSEVTATCTLTEGSKIKITWVKPEVPEITNYESYEFTNDNMDVADLTADMGVFQLVGWDDETGMTVYLAMYADQLYGHYTIDDVYTSATALFVDENDGDGVQAFDLTMDVVETSTGFTATCVYDGYNGTEYTLVFNYTDPDKGGEEEGGDEPTAVQVTKDANGIITAVTGGVQKNFERSANGTAYFVSGTQMSYSTQSGYCTIVEDGNDVYIKDPISRYAQGSWVKGFKQGNMVLIETKQPLAYSTQYAATISLRYGVVTSTGSIAPADDYADYFVYTVDGNTWTLQNTEGFENASGDAYFMGAFWDDDDSATGYGDAETVLTYDPGYVAPSTELVTPPAGITAAEWYLNGTQVSSTEEIAIKNQKVGFAVYGNEIYVKGLFKDFPEAWIKGIMDTQNNTITFAKGQYIGKYGTNDIWFMGTDGEGLTDATATLSEYHDSFTFTSDLLANGATDRIYYLQWITNAVISSSAAEIVEPIITNLTASLPYVNAFETEAEVAEAAIYDANEDGKTWTIVQDTKTMSQAARYTYHSSNTGDDYIVFPGVTLEAGKSYKVSVDARSNSTYYPETIEVVCGSVAKASALNNVVVPATVLGGDYETLVGTIEPETTGVYYVALHAVSEPDQFYLYADNFSISENDPYAPVAVSDLVAVADEAAALKATIRFTMPNATVAGDEIAGMLQYTINRNGAMIKTGIAAAGSVVEYVDENVEDMGDVKYSVVISLGAHVSDVATTTVYVGEDVPADPENFVATDLSGKVGLTWDAVTEGATGGVVLPENVRYNVYPVEMVEFWGMLFPDIDYENPYLTGLSQTNATVDFDTNSGEQAYTYFGVTAENAAGESTGVMAATLTGAPYAMPVVETIPGGQGLDYWWGYDVDEENYAQEGGLAVGNEGDFVFSMATAGWVELYSGKISIEGALNPAVSFGYKGDGALQVIAYGPSKTLAPVVLTPGAEYATAKVALSELADQPWVRFTVRGEYEAAGETHIKNVTVMDMVANNLTASISAPKSVAAGASANVVVTVKNEGEQTASDYVVKVYANDEVIDEFTADQTDEIAFMQTAQYVVTYTTSIFTEAQDVTLKAEVVYAADEKEADNTVETVIAVVASSATPVESVVAESVDGGVKVDWTISSTSAQQVVEDFESYEGNTIYADGESCGPWAAIDLSQGSTYGWNGSIPFWGNGDPSYMGASYAFGIMNFETAQLSGSFSAVSGNQVALFMSEVNQVSQNGQKADKYMISPELPGVAQTISFMALPITTQYGAETFEILASSTDKNVASFTKVASLSSMDETWTEYSAQLPEGTKYFAIHYTSNDIFGLYIDDLKYTVGGGAPTGFNIYVDEAQVASVDADARTYTVADVPAGEHKVSVTAVYGNVESAPVNSTVEVAKDALTGDFVLQNVATGTYLNGSNDWGTRASVTKHGQFMTLAKLEDGKYTIDSHISNGGANHFLGTNGYVDAAAVGYEFTKVEDGIYTIKNGDNYLTTNENDTRVDFAATEVTEAAMWKLMSKEDIIALGAVASAEAPVDFTALVPNADFSRNNQDKNLWEGASQMGVGGPNTAEGATARGMNAERWGGNSTSIDYYTTLNGLPEGYYSIKFQGLYRYNTTTDNTNDIASAAHADGTEEICVNFIANETSVPFMSIADENAVATYGKMPFSQTEASEAFTLGCYQNEIAALEVTNGTLTLKIQKLEADHKGCDWTVLDNIELYYLGADKPTSIDMVKNNVVYGNMGIFNLAGQKLGKPVKGVNIINGKKVVIK